MYSNGSLELFSPRETVITASPSPSNWEIPQTSHSGKSDVPIDQTVLLEILKDCSPPVYGKWSDRPVSAISNSWGNDSLKHDTAEAQTNINQIAL